MVPMWVHLGAYSYPYATGMHLLSHIAYCFSSPNNNITIIYQLNVILTIVSFSLIVYYTSSQNLPHFKGGNAIFVSPYLPHNNNNNYYQHMRLWALLYLSAQSFSPSWDSFLHIFSEKVPILFSITYNYKC